MGLGSAVPLVLVKFDVAVTKVVSSYDSVGVGTAVRLV